MAYENESSQFVVFRLDKEEYAFDISHVREIHTLQEIAKVHRAPEYIEGVMNLRGKLITIIDLRKRFKLDAKAPDGSSRIVVVDSSDAPVGFLVDEVKEVIRLAKESIEPIPDYVAQGIESEYVLGIAKQESRLITLIDPAKVLELSCGSEGSDGGN
ncbi:MAG TPA: chemotaxis protein CheW [Thermoplasmata archaeon]|nr:chemotaxis protein CheW [Thermoplasmata archaeon]